jgi:hypothetical protein
LICESDARLVDGVLTKIIVSSDGDSTFHAVKRIAGMHLDGIKFDFVTDEFSLLKLLQ